jgi:hypothetical protein
MASITDDLITHILSLPSTEQWSVVEKVLKSLKNTTPHNKKKAKQQKSDVADAPKREANLYIQLTSVVNTLLKKYTETLSDEEKKAASTATARTQISSAIYAPIKALAKEQQKEAATALLTSVTEKDVINAYNNWKASPPTPHSKTKDNVSVASKNVKENDNASLSSNESNDGSEDEADAPEPVDWNHWEFNLKGAKASDTIVTYRRYDIDGKAYIYKKDSGAFLGLYLPSIDKLNVKADNPLSE